MLRLRVAKGGGDDIAKINKILIVFKIRKVNFPDLRNCLVEAADS